MLKLMTVNVRPDCAVFSLPRGKGGEDRACACNEGCYPEGGHQDFPRQGPSYGGGKCRHCKIWQGEGEQRRRGPQAGIDVSSVGRTASGDEECHAQYLGCETQREFQHGFSLNRNQRDGEKSPSVLLFNVFALKDVAVRVSLSMSASRILKVLFCRGVRRDGRWMSGKTA